MSGSSTPAARRRPTGSTIACRRQIAAIAGAALLASAIGAPVAPAAKKSSKRSNATIVTLKIPSGGDITYGQAQVRIGKGPKSMRNTRSTVYRGRVGGLTVRATTGAKRSRRKALKVGVVVSRVSGESSKLRNITFLITRKKGVKSSKRLSGTVRFRVANARPVTSSYWVKSAKRSGHTRVFNQRNAIGTALGNWSRYLDVLDKAGARVAAHRAVDVHGQFRARPQPAAEAPEDADATATATAAKKKSSSKKKKKSKSVTTIAGGSVWLGAKGASKRSREVLGLIFGTMSDRVAFQAAKNSPLAAEFIRKDLGNRALAERFEKTVALLPLIVPDQFAAAAAEEKRFTTVKKARISQSQVTVFDGENASAQAAIEVPRSAADTAPGARILVQLEGAGDVYDKARKDGQPVGTIDCPEFFCSGFFPTDRVTDVRLTVQARPGHEIKTLDGCTGGINSRELTRATCEVKVKSAVDQPTYKVAVRFGPATPAPPPGATAPGVPPAPPSPPPAAGVLDTTFGVAGLVRRRVGQGRYPGYGSAEGGATDVLRLVDGRILSVATGTDAGGHHVTYVTRHLPSGALDTTFGALGVVEIDQAPGVMSGPAGEFIGRALALQGDDVVVAGGFIPDGDTVSRFAALRLHGADGALDSSFAPPSTIAVVDVGGPGEARDVVVDPADGTVYLAGTFPAPDPSGIAPTFAALADDGTPIAGFGTGGVFAAPLPGAKIAGIALNGDGIVAVGDAPSGVPFESTALMLQVTKTGALDPAFNGGSPLLRPLGTGPYQTLRGVTVAPDGKIVTVGDGPSGAFVHCLTIRRVTATGAVDPSFAGGADVFECPASASDTSAGMSVLVDGVGRIYAGGFEYSSTAGVTRALLTRRAADGSPDPAFAGGRVVLRTSSATEHSQASALALDAGKPVLAGYAAPDDGSGFPQPTAIDVLLARFTG